MSDKLHARSPLGTLSNEPTRAHGGADPVRLVEQPLGLAYTLRFDESDTDSIVAVAKLTGLRLQRAARAVAANGSLALWLGPGEWLIRFAPESSAPVALAESITARCTAIDTSDLWFVARLHGACSTDVLAKGCGLDLGPHEFAPGAAAVTQFARIRALIHYVDASPAYDVYVERSYAAYVWAWLVDAMSEFLHLKER